MVQVTALTVAAVEVVVVKFMVNPHLLPVERLTR
jgi:hypothetical protein